MCVNTELELPSQRDTILTFFERMQKQFPSMGNFSRRNNNDCCLQGDRNSGRYRWVSIWSRFPATARPANIADKIIISISINRPFLSLVTNQPSKNPWNKPGQGL